MRKISELFSSYKRTYTYTKTHNKYNLIRKTVGWFNEASIYHISWRWMTTWLVNNELEQTWKEGHTEPVFPTVPAENQGSSVKGQAVLLRFEAWTSRISSQIVRDFIMTFGLMDDIKIIFVNVKLFTIRNFPSSFL